MQFVFMGVPGESHESVNMYGTAFPLGEPVEMANAKFAAKLANHPHFCAVVNPVVTEETQTQESPAEPEKATEPTEPTAEPAKRGPGRPKKA